MTLQYLGTTAKQVAMVWACAADNVWLKKCMECEVVSVVEALVI